MLVEACTAEFFPRCRANFRRGANEIHQVD